MVIINPGRKSKPINYFGVCPVCGCEFKCEKNEVKIGYYCDNTEFATASCPEKECGADVNLIAYHEFEDEL